MYKQDKIVRNIKTMEIKENNTIGDIVAKDYRTAAVFKSFGIDFCCGGGKTLQAACKDKNVDISELNDKLEKLDAKEEGDVDFLSFEVNELIDHIESRHHTYVEEKLPVIAAFLKKLESVHGVSHPELKEVKALFNSSVGDLAIHMKKEELVLFPYINNSSFKFSF